MNDHLLLLERARLEGEREKGELTRRLELVGNQVTHMSDQVRLLERAREEEERKKDVFQKQAAHLNSIAEQYKEQGEQVVGTLQGQLNTVLNEKAEPSLRGG